MCHECGCHGTVTSDYSVTSGTVTSYYSVTRPSSAPVPRLTTPTLTVGVQTEQDDDHHHITPERPASAQERPLSVTPGMTRSRISHSYDRDLPEETPLIKPTSLEDFKMLLQDRKYVSKSFRDILHSFDNRFSVIQEEPDITDRRMSSNFGGTLV